MATRCAGSIFYNKCLYLKQSSSQSCSHFDLWRHKVVKTLAFFCCGRLTTVESFSFRKLFGMRKWFIALFYLNALLSQFNQIPRTFCEWSICFLDLQPESWICRSFQQMQTTENLYRYCNEGLEFEVSKTDTVGKILMGFGLRPLGLHLPV